MTYLPYWLGTEGQSQLTALKETVVTDLPHCPERSGERPLTVRKTRTQTIRCPERPGHRRFAVRKDQESDDSPPLGESCRYASARPCPSGTLTPSSDCRRRRRPASAATTVRGGRGLRRTVDRQLRQRGSRTGALSASSGQHSTSQETTFQYPLEREC